MQTPVDHLLSVQLAEAVFVFVGMKSPEHTYPLQIHMVALVSAFLFHLNCNHNATYKCLFFLFCFAESILTSFMYTPSVLSKHVATVFLTLNSCL